MNIEKLKTDLFDLDLSVRGYNILKSAGCKTVEDAVKIFFNDDYERIQRVQEIKNLYAEKIKTVEIIHVNNCHFVQTIADKVIFKVLEMKSIRDKELFICEKNELVKMLDSVTTTTKAVQSPLGEKTILIIQEVFEEHLEILKS
jgi:hypothetical protein